MNNKGSYYNPELNRKGFGAIMLRSVLQIVRRPLYWLAFFALPLFLMLLLTAMMENGIPSKVPAAVIDMDGSQLSRSLGQSLESMQMVDVVATGNSYTQGRHMVQEGKIYGFFLIPENYEQDLLAGRGPQITYYTNMTYFVPANLLFRTFTTTALYTKAGLAVSVIEDLGMSGNAGMLQPINIQSRGIGNPGMNYAIYLCNSFVPAGFQLMILLVTCFSLGQEIKYHVSPRLMAMADGSILKALAAKLLPQTIIWVILIIFMEAWLFRYQGFPMHGSWGWLTLSEILFVLASQGMGVFLFGAIPNMRLSLSVAALLGILAFSLAAFSFPEQSMYPALGILSWIYPTRYNFLIYVQQALNGTSIYWSRIWFAAYLGFMILPATVIWRIKREYLRPVYVP